MVCFALCAAQREVKCCDEVVLVVRGAGEGAFCALLCEIGFGVLCRRHVGQGAWLICTR